jgi:raffinose/stachyose/melibiose transport system substrate-binding protein
MKRLLVLLLILLLLCMTVIGCNSQTSSGSDVTEIEFFSNKSENITILKELIEKFEKEHPNIKVRFVAPPDADTVIRTRVAKDSLPDVIALGVFRDIAKAGVLRNLADEEITKNIQPAYLDIIATENDLTEDEVIGLPYSVNANGLIYNKDKLKKLGFNGPPKTWDEFITMLDTAKEKGEIPIQFTLKDSWTGLIFFNSLAANLQSENFAKEKDEKQTTFQKEYSVVADRMLQLLDYGHTDNFGRSYVDGSSDFAKGEGVFYLQGNWAIPEILKANPEANIGMTAFPTSDNESQNKLVTGVDMTLLMPKNAKHPKEAMTFISFLFEPENVRTYIENQNMFATIDNVFQENEYLKDLEPFFENNQVIGYPDHAYPQGLKPENFLQEYLISKNKEAFLKKMDKEWDKIMERSRF